MIKEVDGNLIQMAKDGLFDVIAHGCNCQHRMKRGIAKQIKFEVPESFAVDLETVKGDVNKLGTISCTKLHQPYTVVNCYTQFRYGKEVKVYADYEAIEKSLTLVKEVFKGKRIGIPKIGAGRARGDWNIIKKIIEKVFNEPEDDLTIVTYNA